MKVIYTEAAEKELLEFGRRQQILLEEIVSEKKSVFGDDILEITASDIKEAAHQIRPLNRRFLRYRTTEVITRAYGILGLFVMVGAAFYPQIEYIVENNRGQALGFLMGGAMFAVGLVMGQWAKFRRRRFESEMARIGTIRSKDSVSDI